MVCGCCGNGFYFGKLMYVFEKIAAFMAMSAIISCIIVTVMISIGIGVGIGYNYCFVEKKIDSEDTGSTASTTPETNSTSNNTSKAPRRHLNVPTTNLFANLAAEPRGFANEPRLPDDSRSFLDGSDYPRGEESDERIIPATEGHEEDLSDSQEEQISNSNIHTGRGSSNSPGPTRRIHSKAGSAIFVPRSGRRNKLQRFKATNLRRSQFDEIREGVRANAKLIDDSSKTKIEDDYVTEEAEYVHTVRKTKYRRRKPIHRKNHDKTTKNTTDTIVIPMKKYANISPLLSKILAENKNVTLQFITI